MNIPVRDWTETHTSLGNRLIDNYSYSRNYRHRWDGSTNSSNTTPVRGWASPFANRRIRRSAEHSCFPSGFNQNSVIVLLLFRALQETSVSRICINLKVSSEWFQTPFLISLTLLDALVHLSHHKHIVVRSSPHLEIKDAFWLFCPPYS